MFQLIILTLLLNLPITPMPSESVIIDGVRGNRPIVSLSKVNWWQDSAHPGEGSNVVLYGHSPGVFVTMHSIRPGAVINVHWEGRDYAYVVRRVFIVEQGKDQLKEGHWIDPTPAERLTLVTCVGDDRLIVLAEALK